MDYLGRGKEYVAPPSQIIGGGGGRPPPPRPPPLGLPLPTPMIVALFCTSSEAISSPLSQGSLFARVSTCDSRRPVSNARGR